MTTRHLPQSLAVILLLPLLAVISPLSPVHSLGSASTIAVTDASRTVCGIVAEEPTQRIECRTGPPQNQTVIRISPNASFEAISGGRDFFCGLRTGGSSFFCWDTNNFQQKRVFNGHVRLKDLTVGEDQVCAIEVASGIPRCWWRGRESRESRYLGPEKDKFESVTSGSGYSCGVLKGSRRVRCWGQRGSVATSTEAQFGNASMVSLVSGESHICGMDSYGHLICRGNNGSGQSEVPENLGAFEVGEMALGANHSCAIRKSNGSVVCWGGGGVVGGVKGVEGLSFESIVSGSDFVCGLVSGNLSVVCWGTNMGVLKVPLPKIIPGPCTAEASASVCQCGVYLDSQTLCSESGSICKKCSAGAQLAPPTPTPSSLPPPPPVSRAGSKGRRKGLLAFAIVGAVGALFGICTVVYCLWTGVCCCNHKKIHNSVQPTITGSNGNAHQSGSGPFTPPFSRSGTMRRQSSRAMRRQRSGTSSKHPDRAEEFTLSELAAATDNFSLENKIGAGSFGTVYKGKLADGREVAIKRGETSLKTKKFQEKESAFQSELAFLSRLHHKHLVGLVGFCEEKEERLLVYEYMKNGALYDHLHSKSNTEKSSSVVNSWKMRIKISLDAARGIEYLHNYAVPPIIHRDIKSSNILLDANWIARVSDFGLSLMGPGSQREFLPAKAAGTVGYMDPEYYKLNVLTSKSDVYGLGVVLLELLTGRRAIFKDEEEGGYPVSVVDFAVPKIASGELQRVLDVRVGAPEIKEAEAVELMAYTAVHCVSLESRERPSMTDIVANLERALVLCDDSHGSISSATFSIVSE